MCLKVCGVHAGVTHGELDSALGLHVHKVMLASWNPVQNMSLNILAKQMKGGRA